VTGTPIVLHELTKVFDGIAVVDRVSLKVGAGEIYGLLGPNGAGKTTTLRMLAGLLQPTSGHAIVAGVDVAAAPGAAKSRLGFLTGTTGLYARLTAREVLVYFGRIHGMDDGQIDRRIELLGGSLGLVDILPRRCEALSTGQKQRVSVARAVLHDPPVLILDEPTAGLDVLASRFLRDFVRAERERGKAVVFSTHYLAEAELLCDRIGLLHRGQLLREGTPAALRQETGASSLEEAFLRLVERLDGAVVPELERTS